jgi:PAS domain S-box-containing protein
MRRILLVDDKEENLYLLRIVFESKKFEVLTALHGAQALDILRNDREFDIIVSDILMPVMDGFSLCIECKKDALLKNIPFVFYTATYTDQKDKEFAMGLGADLFLIKPLEPEEIKKEVTHLLSNKSKTDTSKNPLHEDEKVVLKLYNQTLVRKLEEKSADLEKSNLLLKEQIAELKRLQKALTKNEKLLRETTSSIPGVVFQFLLDTDGSMKFTFVSTGAYHILGLPNEEIYSEAQKAFGRIHPDDIKPVMDGIAHSAAELTQWSVIFRAQHLDGSYKWVNGNAIPKRKKEGATLWNGTLIDYTEIKNYQITLEENNRELTKINAELDRFVYSASHDLRSPLTSLLGLIELTAMETQDENVLQNIELMKETVNRLDDFIHKILDYSRNSRIQLAYEKINWEKIIAKVYKNLRFIYKENALKFDTKVQQDGDFYSDTERVSIVLNNLLGNAIKYRDTEKAKAHIKVSVISNAQRVHLRIEDNGIGIDEENIPKVFEMFYRATSQSSGSGLGLYIVKETLEKLHGTIDIQSEPGVGTTCIIEIPNLPPS